MLQVEFVIKWKMLLIERTEKRTDRFMFTVNDETI